MSGVSVKTLFGLLAEVKAKVLNQRCNRFVDTRDALDLFRLQGEVHIWTLAR